MASQKSLSEQASENYDIIGASGTVAFQAAVGIDLDAVYKVPLEERFRALQDRSAQLRIKHFFDFTGAACALLMLLPLFLVVALLIKAGSPGPVLFRQERWGQNLRKIRIYKFRTMYTDLCDVTGVEQTKANDHRITPIGAVLRKYNIDELPQLLNVLLGEMSLVGPRCHAVGMKASGVLYEELVPFYHLRHLIRPGLTGLAQTRGLRGPTDRASKARARVASDIHYIDNFSLWLDIKIIVATLTGSKGSLGF